MTQAETRDGIVTTALKWPTAGSVIGGSDGTMVRHAGITDRK